jgi:hypothetical protein
MVFTMKVILWLIIAAIKMLESIKTGKHIYILELSEHIDS